MNEKIVYTTGAGAPSSQEPFKQQNPVLVRLEKSGRKGKAVTTLSGFQMHPQGKIDLQKKFQKMCGAGGTMKMGVIEIQGDHRNKIKTELEKMGYKVKLGN